MMIEKLSSVTLTLRGRYMDGIDYIGNILSLSLFSISLSFSLSKFPYFDLWFMTWNLLTNNENWLILQ